MNNFTCFLISNKPQYYKCLKKSISPYKLKFHDGTNINSFASLVNSCVEQSKTEIIILMSDKVNPKPEDVERTLTLINKGYGLVALMRFAFFGLKKDLFRTIGPLDERFVSGGYEDDDFYIRLKESNVAMYVTHDVEYIQRPSSFNYNINRPFFIKKWIPEYNPNIKLHQNKICRQLPEEKSRRDFGTYTGSEFLPWQESYVKTTKALKFIKGH